MLVSLGARWHVDLPEMRRRREEAQSKEVQRFELMRRWPVK
jgi:hypothetical protein